MDILSRIGELKFSGLWQLAWIGIKNPLLVFPTHRATSRTMAICNALFAGSHHLDNKANAFRHALWNILIAQEVLATVKSTENAVQWAERITSLHERLMPNPPLQEAMDLHNNEAGRMFFSHLQNASEEEIIQYLKDKAEGAVQIKSVAETQKLKGKLVFIEE